MHGAYRVLEAPPPTYPHGDTVITGVTSGRLTGGKISSPSQPCVRQRNEYEIVTKMRPIKQLSFPKC